MIVKLDTTQIESAIAEILIRTQFVQWVDKIPQTAKETESQPQKAVDYYLCQGETLSLEQPKFQALINMQTAMIIRALIAFGKEL